MAITISKKRLGILRPAVAVHVDEPPPEQQQAVQVVVFDLVDRVVVVGGGEVYLLGAGSVVTAPPEGEVAIGLGYRPAQIIKAI